MIVTLVGVLAGLIISSLLPQRARTSLEIVSTGRVLRENPYLAIQVSPPGYPSMGESWTISVYIVNVTSPRAPPKFQSALNSTVVVTVLSNGQKQTYDFPVDENGRASFQFLPEYSDIAFQAYRLGLLPSEKFILSEHYVSSQVVDSLLSYNLIVSIFGSPVSGLIIHKKRIGKLASLTLFSIISLFCFVWFFSLYSKLFQYTTWGYPDNIVGGFITFNLLRHISYLGTVLIVLFWIIFWLRAQEFKV